jgi:hypothetical protein
MNENIFDCPHCYKPILVYNKDLNCRIFRHGIYKNTYKQIDPHLEKKKCDDLVEKKEIFGCGKPFRIRGDHGNYYIEICEYI